MKTNEKRVNETLENTKTINKKGEKTMKTNYNFKGSDNTVIVDMWADVIYGLLEKINKLPDSESHARAGFIKVLGEAVRVLTDYIVPEASIPAAKFIESKGADYSKLTWANHPKIDPGRKNIVREHMTTCYEIKNKINASLNIEEVTDILTNDLRIVWITKAEDAKLTELGYKSRRPDPVKAYKEAGIEILI